MRIDKLFTIKNGLPSSSVNISMIKTKDFYIPFIRPSSNYYNLVVGYVNEYQIKDACIFPPDTLFVSTNGEGSHSYSYVSPVKFVPNSDISVLIPKKEMSLSEKIFYAMVITKNRYRFSYGRKPKGQRFASINIPAMEEIPKWVNNIVAHDIPKPLPVTANAHNLNIRDWRQFTFNKIFEIRKGKRLTLKDQIGGTIPYVSSSSLNNGIDNYIGNGFTDENCITFACYGSIGEVFYQKEKVWVSDNANVFYLKGKTLNSYIAMFLITILRLEKFRFSYGVTGKKERLEKFTTKLPSDEKGNPDWQFMEDYIKSLPYSSNL